MRQQIQSYDLDSMIAYCARFKTQKTVAFWADTVLLVVLDYGDAEEAGWSDHWIAYDKACKDDCAKFVSATGIYTVHGTPAGFEDFFTLQ